LEVVEEEEEEEEEKEDEEEIYTGKEFCKKDIFQQIYGSLGKPWCAIPLYNTLDFSKGTGYILSKVGCVIWKRCRKSFCDM